MVAPLDQRVLELTELLHKAPGSGSAFLRFLERLRDAISPDTVALFAAQAHEQRPGLFAASGLGVSAVYLGDFLRPSVRHPAAVEVPLGSVHEISPTHPVFGVSVLFREVLEPAGVLPGPGLFVVTERDGQHILSLTMVLPTTPRWKPKAADRAFLERLAPHLVIARRLHNRLAERHRDSEALLQVFDQLVLGVLFLDERGRVSFANGSAAEILGVKPGFVSTASLSGPVADDRTQALERMLRSEQGPLSARVCAHPADGRPLQVLSTTFRWESEGAERMDSARFARALFIGDPKQRTGDPIGVLREVYGLTPGETRLTLLLISGCSLAEAAHLLGISVGTCRGVLKKVFEKTGTNRQASLVRSMLTGFGQVRSGAVGKEPT